MKNKINIILSCCLIAIAVTVTAVGLTGSRVKRGNLRCKDIEIQVLDSTSNLFTTREDLIRILNEEFGSYRNRLADSVNLYRLERVMKKHKYIEECCAYFTQDGTLHLTIRQCTPVVKLETDSTGWYLDKRGECFPMMKDWSTEILSIKGSPRIRDSKWTSRVAAMATWIYGEHKWNGRVSRISSAPDGELTLYLEGRDERFLIGQPVKIKEKFRRMHSYIENVASDSTFKGYRSVNVKYNGQIVCKQ